MTDHIRWGILGAGNIAHRFAQDMQHSTTGVLSAIASRTASRAQEFAAAYSTCQAFDDYALMVASDAVDAVYVATPNSLHCDHALLAINAGKAVLVEKPFATTSAEASKIADVARTAGVFCMEALWTRFLPTMVDINQKVVNSDLGGILQLQISLGFPRLAEEGDPITDPALGGGALMDLGIYGVSMADYLLGPSTVVSASQSQSVIGSARDVAVLLRHDGTTGSPLTTITASHGTELTNTLCLFGTQGKIVTDAPFIQCQRAWQRPVKMGEGRGQVPSASGVKGALKNSPLWPIIRRVGKAVTSNDGLSFGQGFPGTGLQFQIDEVGRCVKGQKTQSDRMPLARSVATIEQLEAISAMGR
ncbi:Gfo/Idh/MocA family protein [Actibacterium sp. 188UL27-1]|uniref:Gfo/Idh/MocA family protein n=1 Tax=Actibacterium sp. 188UL27-1 TaxID=2786961 RepID=UPI00195B8B9B|nr:Gfo/Idh/MocA family oxidoreductase [Actibacterium sp. 188UL27-1]MBM7069109.1 Gfo/Idh/MocA family oxidoreductase [Actibacterium sp. 188UL27-1]